MQAAIFGDESEFMLEGSFVPLAAENVSKVLKWGEEKIDSCIFILHLCNSLQRMDQLQDVK